jgi:hypothetical protein
MKMNVSELYALTEWVDKEISNGQIVQKYQTLLNILSTNSQPNQQKRPFEAEKNTLIKALEQIDFDGLTKDQIEYLGMFSIAPYVGAEGVNLTNDILYKNVIDIATSAAKFKEIIQKINQGIQKTQQIKSGLTDIVTEAEFETNQNVLVRVSFRGDAGIHNISDFKEYGCIWFEIGYGVALAHNLPPEEIKIIGASTGSIILELVVVCAIAKTISTIILSALKVAERILDIQKKAEEIRALKIKNDKVAIELEKESEAEKKNGVENIVQEVMSLLKIEADKEGDKIPALSKSIGNLVTFIEKGGNVDFVLPKEIDSSDNKEKFPDFSELRNAFTEIRKLETKIILLEQKTKSE